MSRRVAAEGLEPWREKAPRRRRRVIILITLAVLATAVTAAVTFSKATFTTASQSTVSATADSVGNWLSVYSQSTDPDGLGNYAHQENLISRPLIATLQNKDLAIDWGSYPDVNKTFTFSRLLTIKTPAAFPDASISQITVTVTLAPDPGGTQPLRNAYLHLTTGTGSNNWVTLGPNSKAQLDIRLRTKKNPWDAGDLFRPHVVLTVTFAGQTTAYYVYDFTTTLHII